VATTRESKVCSAASVLPYVLLTSLRIHVAIVGVGRCWRIRGSVGKLDKRNKELNLLEPEFYI